MVSMFIQCFSSRSGSKYAWDFFRVKLKLSKFSSHALIQLRFLFVLWYNYYFNFLCPDYKRRQEKTQYICIFSILTNSVMIHQKQSLITCSLFTMQPTQFTSIPIFVSYSSTATCVRICSYFAILNDLCFLITFALLESCFTKLPLIFHW